jgi:multiple sugar transport system ATP-binding protein
METSEPISFAGLSPARLRVRGLQVDFPGPRRTGQRVLHGIDLAVGVDDRLVVMGPSGCGKTTLLRAIAGLERPAAGTVEIDGEQVTDWPPHRRDLAMVFQQPVLYPHLTVAANLDFPLRARRMPRVERRQRVEQIAELLRITELLSKSPTVLSGGQQQRVALARGLVRQPRLVMLDEPLAHLDTRARDELLDAMLDAQRAVPVPWIYVTHDHAEAVRVGNRMALMADGRIHQIGAPQTLYDRPCSPLVAQLTGSIRPNTLEDVTITRDRIARWCGTVLGTTNSPGPCSAIAIVRTEAIRAEPVSHDQATEGLRAIVRSSQWIDGAQRVEFDCQGQLLRALVSHQPTLAIGAPCQIRLQSESVHLFDARNGQRIEWSSVRK